MPQEKERNTGDVRGE